MSKSKTPEQPFNPVKERILRKQKFGSKSVVSGEDYIDPNEEGWKNYYQQQEDKKKEK